MKDIEGQISLFDVLGQSDKPDTDIQSYLKEAIMHGTGFANGKKRVCELYQQEMSSQERAYAIKKKYGIGGAGWPLEGYGLHGYNSYHNGLTIEWIAATEACGYTPITRVVSEAELKEIIEQAATEYNNGWIPTSERLPEESGRYCVTTEDVETGERIEQTVWFAHKDDYDMDESEWRELCDYEKVIAWKKSEPYQPKGE